MCVHVCVSVCVCIQYCMSPHIISGIVFVQLGPCIVFQNKEVPFISGAV